MLSDVSILLPVYNVAVQELVTELHRQASQLMVPFEIRAYDDGSEEAVKQQNRAIAELPQVVYQELPQNLGRSAIRNRLAQDAKYRQLLFLDSDSALPDSSFLKAYKQRPTNPDVLIGGTIYALQRPAPEQLLRWVYGHQRESKSALTRSKAPYASFTLNNALIDRDLFLRIRLDESISTYGHEDTAFGEALRKEGVTVHHTDNPVIHTGLETADAFLEKTRLAVENLYRLYREQGIGADTKLVKSFKLLEQTGMVKPFVAFAKGQEQRVLQNLRSQNPSLRQFDLYKLYLFASLAV